MTALVPELPPIVKRLFPRDHVAVYALLEEWAKKHVLHWKESPLRVCAAMLKGSGGDLREFEKLLAMAYMDWRDVLVAAGFAQDADAHQKWLAERHAG